MRDHLSEPMRNGGGVTLSREDRIEILLMGAHFIPLGWSGNPEETREWVIGEVARNDGWFIDWSFWDSRGQRNIPVRWSLLNSGNDGIVDFRVDNLENGAFLVFPHMTDENGVEQNILRGMIRNPMYAMFSSSFTDTTGTEKLFADKR